MVIMFDVDGCLADFIQGYNKMALTIPRQYAVRPLNEGSRWGDYNDVVVWDHIKRSRTFFFELPSMQEFITKPELWMRIAKLEQDNDVYFVTSRQGVHVKRQTQDWLTRRGVYDPSVIITPDKGETARVIKADFAIDDKAGNAMFIKYQRQKCESFILDKPYNQWDPTMVGTKVRRIFSVEEYINAVETGDRA